jgi:hypothetical protein
MLASATPDPDRRRADSTRLRHQGRLSVYRAPCDVLGGGSHYRDLAHAGDQERQSRKLTAVRLGLFAGARSLRKIGIHPRIKSECRHFPDHPLGRVLIKSGRQARCADCPLRSESDRNAAWSPKDAMGPTAWRRLTKLPSDYTVHDGLLCLDRRSGPWVGARGLVLCATDTRVSVAMMNLSVS